MLMSGSWSNRGSQRCKQQRRRWTWSTAKSSFRGDLGTLNQQEMIVCMQRSKDSGDLDYWCVHTDWRSMERGDDVKMPKGLLFNSISHQKNKNLQISYVLIFFAFTVILHQSISTLRLRWHLGYHFIWCYTSCGSFVAI